MYDFKKVKAKQCTEQDFCKGNDCTDSERDKELAKYFKDWAGFSIVCPEFNEQVPHFDIKGDSSMMKQHAMLFTVKKCDPNDPNDTSGLPCEDDDILDKFIKSLTVEIWTVSEKLFYDKEKIG
jgi:hypothetical protein